MIRPRPQADAAKLPRPDAAADEVLVSVEDQVQQVLVGRHGEKAVGFDGVEVGEEMVQLVVRVLGGVEQAGGAARCRAGCRLSCRALRPPMSARPQAYRWSGRLREAAHGRREIRRPESEDRRPR